MEKLSFSPNGQWSLDKSVRGPLDGSYEQPEHGYPLHAEGAAKEMKVRVGDPRHDEKGPITRHGAERDIIVTGKKTSTSGVSTLRPSKHTPEARETAPERGSGKQIKINSP